MKHQKFSNLYKERILSLFHDESSKLLSTEMLSEARKSYFKNLPDGKIKWYNGMGNGTFYRYRDSLEKDGFIKRLPQNPNNLREVYFVKCKAKLLQMSEEMIDKITDSLLTDLRKEVKKTIASELKYVKKEENLTEKEERAFVNEIINEEELKLTLGRILVKHGKELKRSAYRLTMS